MSSARLNTAEARAVHESSSAASMLRLVCLIAASAALAPALAHAGSDTDTFEVTATVLASCEVTAADLTFGNYDPVAAANLDAETQLSLTCTNGTPYQVGLSLGDGSGASMATRRMTKIADTETLDYVLYQDDQRSVLWGDAGGDRLSGTGAGAAEVIDVYGRIPMQQTAPAGDYSDTIVVTVTW